MIKNILYSALGGFPDSRFAFYYFFMVYFQVKIIKFLVENIVVDISFNQLGGLCTLCFLEEVRSSFWTPYTGSLSSKKYTTMMFVSIL